MCGRGAARSWPCETGVCDRSKVGLAFRCTEACRLCGGDAVLCTGDVHRWAGEDAPGVGDMRPCERNVGVASGVVCLCEGDAAERAGDALGDIT